MKYPSIARTFTASSVMMLLLTLGAALYSQSDTVVKWGGNYFTGTGSQLALSRTPEQSGDSYLIPYSFSSPLSPTSGYDYDHSSATFYGAIQSYAGTGNTSPIFRLNSHSGVNSMAFISGHADSEHPVFVLGLIGWKKEDFLHGYNNTPDLTFDQLGELSLNANFIRSRGQPGELRFAVQGTVDGVTGWYLSAATQQRSTGAAGTTNIELSLNDLSNSKWGLYLIDSTTTSLNTAPETYDISGSAITDITAIGFYFFATYNLSNRAAIEVNDFTVTSTIPEPSSTRLAFGGLVLLAIAFRRFA